MKVLTCKTSPYETMITSIKLLISNNGYNMYIAGQANGVIKIFTCSKADQVAELQGHSRSVNGLACHSLKPLFATVSDDTIVNLWFCKFEDSSHDLKDIELIKSTRIPNNLLVGVVFGNEEKTLLVSPYDYKYLIHFPDII